MKDSEKINMAELIFALRQKCALKDLYIVKSLGITPAEYNCLIQFFRADSRGIKELARKLEITPGGITRIITSLEEKGIIGRHISLEDRRNIDVILTPRGKEIVAKIQETTLDLHTEILEQIEPEHRQPVVQAIEKLINAIDSWLKERDEDLDLDN